jgi:Uma2 family endonuclease
MAISSTTALTMRPMTWQDVLDDPSLQNLPYKIELDQRGRIVMSPATRLHALYAGVIADLLRDLKPEGYRTPESPVQTKLGIRVPDMTWLSLERHRSQTGNVFSVAPEICVEIISPSNTPEEINTKIGLYFEAGALEVWTCDLSGKMTFHGADETLTASKLVPNFPGQINVD